MLHDGCLVRSSIFFFSSVLCVFRQKHYSPSLCSMFNVQCSMFNDFKWMNFAHPPFSQLCPWNHILLTESTFVHHSITWGQHSIVLLFAPWLTKGSFVHHSITLGQHSIHSWLCCCLHHNIHRALLFIIPSLEASTQSTSDYAFVCTMSYRGQFCSSIHH